MELKQLTYFIAVAEEGNISKAAKKLHISQPPLSIQLKHLEEELGCVLFERGAREISLTKAGRLLYERSVSLLELSAITAQEIADLKNETAGVLRLGAVSSVSSTFLTGWIRQLHEKYPAIRYDIFEGNTYEQIEHLKNHTIELALVRTPFPTDGLRITPLQEEPMMAVGHRRFFSGNTREGSADADAVSLSFLADKPLILYRRWEDAIFSAFAKEDLTPFLFCKNADAGTTFHWADAGLGVGIVPRSAISLRCSPDTVCKKIADADLTSRICLIADERHYLSALAGIFLQSADRIDFS